MGLQKSGSPATAEQIARLRSLIKKRTHKRAALLLGLSEATVDRAIGGLNLMPGTRALIEAAIAKRDQEGKNP